MGVMEACCARVLTHLARAMSTTVPSPLTCAPSDALVESSPVHLGARRARCAKRSDRCAHIVQQCGVQSVLHEDEAWDWGNGIWLRCNAPTQRRMSLTAGPARGSCDAEAKSWCWTVARALSTNERDPGFWLAEREQQCHVPRDLVFLKKNGC